MQWISALVAAVILVPLLPVLILLMRREPRMRGGGLGAALSALQEAVDPSRRHVIAAADERPTERTNGEPKLP